MRNLDSWVHASRLCGIGIAWTLFLPGLMDARGLPKAEVWTPLYVQSFIVGLGVREETTIASEAQELRSEADHRLELQQRLAGLAPCL